jgi:hypothetical protein
LGLRGGLLEAEPALDPLAPAAETKALFSGMPASSKVLRV